MPVLRFNKLPDRALVEVKKALDRDDAFRSRLLESLSQSDLEAMDKGARLFLERPAGWEESVAVLASEVSDEADRSGLARREADALRRVEQLEETIDRLTSERDEARAESERGRDSVEGLDRRNERLAAEVEGLRQSLSDSGAERDEAVRQLGEARSLADRRLEEIRELRRQVTDGDADAASPSTGSNPASVDPDASASVRSGEQPSEDGDAAVAPRQSEAPRTRPGSTLDVSAVSALASAVDAADRLAGSLREFSSGLGLPVGESEIAGAPSEPGSSEPVAPTVGGMTPDADPKARGSSSGASRRRAVRLGRGLSADSAEGLDEYLRRPETFVIVDGYNVSMAGWPQQPISTQRDSLVAALGAVAASASADIHVVFDGAHDGARPAVSTPLPVRVHFTEAGVEADDRILEFVDDAPLEDAIVVVSSDARVRDGARDRGAVAVSTPTLIERLRR
ncbi:MAG: NYN domain-containing protein [Microthrixaceae bacterium]